MIGALSDCACTALPTSLAVLFALPVVRGTGCFGAGTNPFRAGIAGAATRLFS